MQSEARLGEGGHQMHSGSTDMIRLSPPTDQSHRQSVEKNAGGGEKKESSIMECVLDKCATACSLCLPSDTSAARAESKCSQPLMSPLLFFLFFRSRTCIHFPSGSAEFPLLRSQKNPKNCPSTFHPSTPNLSEASHESSSETPGG